MHLRGLSWPIVGYSNSLDTVSLRVSRNYLLVGPGFNEQLAARWKRAKHQGGRGGSNSRGVSKSSARYVSTSLEGWIGRGNKMGGRGGGSVKGVGQVEGREVVEGGGWR